jgi:uncharacterized membrane protein YbhN (UPF0104 family)
MRDTWLTVWKRCAPLLWGALAVGALFILAERLQTFTLDQLIDAITAFPPTSVAWAGLCCLAAFTILSAYEFVAVRQVTGRSLLRNAAATSWIAHALGHVIGAALLSGGALRYRRYASVGLSVSDVSAITVLSAIPYVLAAGWLLDAALLLFATEASRALNVPIVIVVCAGAIGLAKDIGWLILVCKRRVLRIGKWSLTLPSLQFTLLQILVGVAEITLVAAILYVFMPATLDMGLVAFTGIFLIAATIAQISHVPAGIGVLEAALLLMLPQVPPQQLLAAIVCYRIVFELIPLLIGTALMIRGEMLGKQAAGDKSVLADP